MKVPDWDSLFATNKDGNESNRRQSGERSRECAEACLALCKDVDPINEFVIAVSSTAYVLQSPKKTHDFMFNLFIFSKK